MKAQTQKATQAQRQAQRQAWAAYKAACGARGDHIDITKCETCWSGHNSHCPTWQELSARIERTLNVWMNL